MLYQIYNEDCLNLKNISNIRLMYMDPPYAGKNEDTYYGVGDNLYQFLNYLEKRLIHLKSFLSTKGSNFLIHMDQKAIHYVKVMLDEILGRDNFQNEIIWCYSNPSVVKSHLPRKHDTILWYGMGEFPFNIPMVPYTGKLKIGGNTSWKGEDVDTSSYLEQGKKLEDWWIDIPALCRNEKEKLGYSTQKPFKLMERIVLAFSNPGDSIMDPFMGSGSLLDAGKRNERIVYGSDISKEAFELTTKRLG